LKPEESQGVEILDHFHKMKT